MRRFGIKTRILVPLTVALAGMLGVFVLSIFLLEKAGVRRSLAEDLAEARGMFRREQDRQLRVMGTAIRAVMRSDALREPFLDGDREALLARTLPLFEDLRADHGVTHFHYLLPDRTSFLRVHRPETRGDRIHRFTARQAESTGAPSAGLDIDERGGFPVLRTVVPWTDEGKTIGFIEMGREILSFADLLAASAGREVFTAVNKRNISREAWERRMSALGRTPEWDRFPGVVIAERTLAEIPEALDTHFRSDRIHSHAAALAADHGGQRYLTGFIPLLSASGEKLGEIALLGNATARLAAARNTALRAGLISLAIGAALFLFLNLFLRNVEDDLEHAQLRLRLQETALESAANAVGIADESGRLVWCNPAFLVLSGTTADEAVGRDLFLPQRSIHPESFFRNIWTVLREGRVWKGELLGRRADGGDYVEETTVTPILDERGEITHFIAVKTDVTERKRAERRLEKARDAAVEASRAKSEFLANMSHEIRTPLNGILGMTGLALETDLTAEQREFLETTRESAESLMAVIGDILDFSKIEAGKLEIDETPFRFRSLLEDTLRALAFRAHDKGLELICRIDPEIPDRLIGDPVRIRQILINLVGNAVKFTDRGEIRVEARAPETGEDRIELELTVADTGIGIPPEQQRRIFLSFTQADGSATRRHGGTGLGLAIVLRLTEMMGGSLDLESEEGRGSLFRMRCPLRIDGSEPTEKPDSGTAFSPEGLSALVVDDNESARKGTARILREWGMETETAADAGEGGERAAARRTGGKPFSVLLVDADLAGEEGAALLRKIREETPAPEPAILIVHARSLPGKDGEPDGVVRLWKPVLPDPLRKALAAALRPSPAGRTGVKEPRFLPRAEKPLRVLLAEDHPVNRRLAVRLLEKAGHTVDVAGNGAEAVEAFDRERFDLVLMDVQMPVMDGLEATRAIRRKEEERGGPPTPIVALTAHARKEDQEKCLDAGMDAYLSKPIRPADLFATLGRMGGGAAPGGGAAAGEKEMSGEAPGYPGIDLPAALALVDDDRELLAEIAGILAESLPRLMTQVENAVAEGESEALERAAHSFRGSLGSVCATGAMNLASEMEDLAREGRFSEAKEILPRLTDEVERLQPSIHALTGSGSPA